MKGVQTYAKTMVDDIEQPQMDFREQILVCYILTYNIISDSFSECWPLKRTLSFQYMCEYVIEYNIYTQIYPQRNICISLYIFYYTCIFCNSNTYHIYIWSPESIL